ncbi:TPA: hypothetical protein L5708_005321, partial [Pseudomonas aeruginosa]|nr:hypothetical protein [Pseudomonas aeruginosa]HBP5834426.1 hypothetical protein [Pseudomonas aeruginosa]
MPSTRSGTSRTRSQSTRTKSRRTTMAFSNERAVRMIEEGITAMRRSH